jgi:THO complex subunit 2
MRTALGHGEEVKAAPKYLQVWHPFHPDIFKAVKNSMPEETSSIISEELFVIFWTLNLNDILIPTAKYDSETKRLRDKYADIDKNLSASGDPKANREKKAEMSKLLSTIKDLSDELENQQKHVAKIKTMVSSRTSRFFAQQMDPSKTTEILLQACVLPRVMMSPADSVFSSQFLMLLHSMETPGFSTIQVMDKMLRTIAPLIFSTTEAEAAFLGYLINDILNVINRWLGNKTLFEEEAQQKSVFLSINSTSDSKVTYEEYQSIYKEWHQKLRVLLSSSLGAGLEQRKREYMHIRSGLVFLSKIVNNFPTRVIGGKELLHQVEIVEKEEMEKRSDLSLFAKRLGSIMQKRKSTWLDDNGKLVVSSPKITKSAISNANDTTSKPNTTSKLNTASNSNKPNTAAKSSATTKPSSVTKPITTTSSKPNTTANAPSKSSNTTNTANGNSNNIKNGGEKNSAPVPSAASSTLKDEKESGRKREREKDDKEKDKSNKERKTDDVKITNNKDSSNNISSKDKDKDSKTKVKDEKVSNDSNSDKNKANDNGSKSKDSNSIKNSDKVKDANPNKGNDQNKDKSSQEVKGRSNSISEKGAGQKRSRDSLEHVSNNSAATSSVAPGHNNNNSSNRFPSRNEKSNGPDRDRGRDSNRCRDIRICK